MPPKTRRKSRRSRNKQYAVKDVGDGGPARKESRIQAAKGGRRVYIHHVACAKCGCVYRYTSNGNCVECAKRRSIDKHKEVRELLRGERNTESEG